MSGTSRIAVVATGANARSRRADSGGRCTLSETVAVALDVSTGDGAVLYRVGAIRRSPHDLHLCSRARDRLDVRVGDVVSVASVDEVGRRSTGRE